MTNIAAALTELYRQLNQSSPVALHEPWLRGNAWSYVKDCLDTGWVSSVGTYVDRFEADMAKQVGTSHAIAVVNGTAALHMALYSIGVGPGDLVACPALTFVATANAIAHCGAMPVFVDCDPAHLGMDPQSLERVLRSYGKAVKAVVPVHVFGHPADMDAISSVAEAYGVTVIEDSTESLGSTYKGRPCGSLGRIGVFSFNGNKIITTGGGGMIVTDDAVLAKRLKHLTTTARIPAGMEFAHDEVGWNYRLPNINAALGCAQLEGLADLVARKRAINAIYREKLGPAIMGEQSWAASNFWLNALVTANIGERNRLLADCAAAGIQARPCWRLMCDLPMYASAPADGKLAQARFAYETIVNLPSSPGLLGPEWRA